MLLSIVIKALNEEVRIEACIQSALKAIDEIGGQGEVILADSLSDDQTVAIAQKYPIKIVQLLDKADRSCGIGAELGYRECSGEFIYILDGDMTLCADFMPTAIEYLRQHSNVAGVAGLVEEMVLTNSAMIGRKEKAENSKPDFNAACLNMGGLYRRSAIQMVGYLTNRNLHSFEEFELGIRLRSKGWSLSRVNVPSIKHYGPACSSLKLLLRRWNTRYACGNGELFKAVWGKPYFWRAIASLRVYRIQMATLLVWLFLILHFSLKNPIHTIWMIFSTWLAVFLWLSVIKLSFAKAAYSLAAWHIGVLGFFKGLGMTNHTSPEAPISNLIIKKLDT